MKKTVSLVLLIALLAALPGCSGGADPVGDFLLAVRKMDVDAMEALMTSDSAAAASRIREYADSLDSDKRAVLVSLYSELKYTITEGTEERDDTKTVLLSLTVPDLSAIKAFAEARMAVSGESAAEIVESLLEGGVVAGSYMTEKKITVALKKEEGTWRIPFSESENAELVAALSLVEMLRFFSLG